jgi:DNA polymerase V
LEYQETSDENIKQLSLFETINEDENKQTEKQEALQKAIDEIRSEFDFLSIQKASSLTKGSRVVVRNKMIGGHAANKEEEEKENDR